MSQQDAIVPREYVTPGMYHRDMFDCCVNESGLRKMKGQLPLG